MKAPEVERQLKAIFAKELTHNRCRHVVFWYDEQGEFADDVDHITLENVRIWKMTEHNLFATKYELETADQDSHFLIYAMMAKPMPREDWLFSQYKLGMEFTTDITTVMMRELGIENDQLHPVFQKYAHFFKNKARKSAFLSYSAESDTAEMVDITVLAALTKSPLNTLDDSVRSLLKEDVKEKNILWENIEKYGDVNTFWQLVERHYGYTLEERTLSSLFTFLCLPICSNNGP